MGVGEAEHRILVKQPSAQKPSTQKRSAAEPVADDRPRLFPKAQPEWKSRFEFRAMSAIEQHVAGLDDPRFGAVRVLELLPDQQSLVLEKVSEKSLGRWLFWASLRPSRHAPGGPLDQALRNAGAWLRRYHELPALEHTQPRGGSREEFLDPLARLCEFLARATRDGSLARLGLELTARATAILPPRFPLGLGHGDYAPRNVLAGPTGRIRVIDTLARWRAPIYEDLSQFLTALKASAPQVLSHGLLCRPQLAAHFERQFLSGYFEGDRIPLDRIRLFECLTLMERWAAMTYRFHEARGWKRLAKGGRAVWSKRFLHDRITHLLAETRTASSAPSLSAAYLPAREAVQ
ncbi:phosphotransferase [Candidatus Laterigemmans baculatus]|uniref:phosphotransferase n=1 Tax=Candidatus Laterigemmans baculatus TaxID=2770505 RepID=UPI0013DC120A|nr:phosphotransferase [Candidatus Laterigemmans baculatus]